MEKWGHLDPEGDLSWPTKDGHDYYDASVEFAAKAKNVIKELA
ncbi:Protein of unknown function [Thermobacillus xylanilyticus]|jgi:hypothetical protein|uniref:Uncharacterized protein n=1 Tax=Thermobacillus xylanilyticus TaxID=76633 RepID=A0ABN7RQH4_THEXY|nr:Protein of unknown function [Thermobacillus xylanilyticus]